MELIELSLWSIGPHAEDAGMQAAADLNNGNLILFVLCGEIMPLLDLYCRLLDGLGYKWNA
jgi:hypothetical protein